MASKQSHLPTICPECKTPQQGLEPFCEHCGFRLRSQETAIEGVPAVTPAQLKREPLPEPMRPRASTQEEPSITSDMLARASSTTPRKKKQTRNTKRKDEQPDHGPSSTFVEGLPAAKVELDSRQETSRPHPLAKPSPVEASGLLPMAPPPPDRLRWLVPLLFGLMSGGVLGTAFTWLAIHDRLDASTQGPSTFRDHTLGASPPNERVAFPREDDVSVGLDDATQARLIKTCYKFSLDARKECAQENLLRDEYPVRAVSIAPFTLDMNEATNTDHEACVTQGACTPLDLKQCKVYTPQGLQISLRVPRALLEPTHPVTCLTHAEAQKLCAWKGGRLPTHEEWELAARGTRDARLFPWGDAWDPEFANWGDRDITGTVAPGRLDGFAWSAPVGIFHKGHSPFGLRDMAGNVSEWVATSKRAPTPQARGGSWLSAPYDLRVTKRLTLDASTARTDVGVRCAYDANTP